MFSDYLVSMLELSEKQEYGDGNGDVEESRDELMIDR